MTMRQRNERSTRVGVTRLSIVAFLLGVKLPTLAIGARRDAENPMSTKWWPSQWGANDQRGPANRITSAKVLEALDIIEKGKIYSLRHIYEHDMPLPGKRHFGLTIPGLPTEFPTGQN